MPKIYKRITYGIGIGGPLLWLFTHLHPAYFLLTIGLIAITYHKITKKGA